MSGAELPLDALWDPTLRMGPSFLELARALEAVGGSVDDDGTFRRFLAELPQHYTLHEIEIAVRNIDRVRYA